MLELLHHHCRYSFSHARQQCFFLGFIWWVYLRNWLVMTYWVMWMIYRGMSATAAGIRWQYLILLGDGSLTVLMGGRKVSLLTSWCTLHGRWCAGIIMIRTAAGATWSLLLMLLHGWWFVHRWSAARRIRHWVNRARDLHDLSENFDWLLFFFFWLFTFGTNLGIKLYEERGETFEQGVQCWAPQGDKVF